MVSPVLTKKQENTLTINDKTKKLFQVIYGDQVGSEDNKSQRIQVSELISKMAFYYEKIRNSVDYKEEYLLRKNAIERILRRHILIEGVIKISKSEEISKNLIIELIRAGYLPNNKLGEEKIEEVSSIIEKYIKLRNYSLSKISASSELKQGNVMKARDNLHDKSEISNWLIAILSSEVEESLGRKRAELVAVSNIYEILSKNIKLPSGLDYKDDLEIQIYLSIHRSFLKFDKKMLSFILFKYYNSEWNKAEDEDIAKISQNIVDLYYTIQKQLKHPLRKQLNLIAKNYTVYYVVLIELIEEDPVKVYDNIKNDPKSFPRLIKNTCLKKYKNIKSKLWRSAMRSIVYIFLTKSIFVFLLEVPAIKFFGEEINLLSLAINITFPAFLLFIVVFFTKIPVDENTAKIVEGIEEITIKEKERKEPFILKKPSKRRGVMSVVFAFIYTITFFISFGTVVWALQKINFTWVSIIIFLFFLAFVSFFGIRIRKGVKEFIIIKPKENIFSFLIDFFYVPIILSGKWLSEKFARVNVIVFILDFIIETPFKIIVEIAEEWTKYLRERKEDIS